jgi:hypothetical protein
VRRLAVAIAQAYVAGEAAGDGTRT